MDREFIQSLAKDFESYATEIDGVECWFARDLQTPLGYDKWENFYKVIQKAKIACENAGNIVADHFLDVGKMVSIGSQATREIELSKLIYERGVDESGFGRIRSKGDAAMFGGHNTRQMKYRLSIPQNRPLADFLPTITITAKNLATEITNFNVRQQSLHGEPAITGEHVKNNAAIRKTLIERGIKPENLPPEEDITKLERRLISENKKSLKQVKKLKRPKKKS